MKVEENRERYVRFSQFEAQAAKENRSKVGIKKDRMITSSWAQTDHNSDTK